MGSNCSTAIPFNPNSDANQRAGGDVWTYTSTSWGADTSLWLELPLAPPAHLGTSAAFNLSACDTLRLTTTEIYVWRGKCDGPQVEFAHVHGPQTTGCQSSLTISAEDLANGPLYAELRRADATAHLAQAATGAWLGPAAAPPSGLSWTCCGGERWVTLPLIGTLHMPQTLEIAKRSFALPVHAVFFLAAWLALSLLACAADALLRRCPTTYRRARRRRRAMLLLAPVLAYLLLAACAAGEAGRLLVAHLSPHEKQSAATSSQLLPSLMPAERRRLERWASEPSRAPLARVPLASSSTSSLPFLAPILSEQYTREIAARIVALRHTHWTVGLGARGMALLTLGTKYGAVLHGGRVLHEAEEIALGQSLWEPFADVYEALRAGLEPVLGAPCRLSRRNHPPCFIMHMPTVLGSHYEAWDVHADVLMPKAMRERVLADVADGRPDRVGATCEWDAQLTILVPLHLPERLEAGLEYYTIADVQWRKRTLAHAVGHALVMESERPHTLKPFPRRAADSPELRMMLHAFAVPCRRGGAGDSGVAGEMEWWVSGVRGGRVDYRRG